MFGLDNPYKELEKSIGYRFKNRDLLETALTHRSHIHENRVGDADNQRLEFLGDAVLGFLVADELYDTVDEAEGLLTSLRSQAASGKALAKVGAALDLGRYLKVGRGEELSGGRTRESNLADAYEAILGAAYLDGGIKAARKLFKKTIVPKVNALSGDFWAENPKGKLQEYSQKNWRKSPQYRVVSREGPAHESFFTVEVQLPDDSSSTGEGGSKRKAEMDAARAMLNKLEI